MWVCKGSRMLAKLSVYTILDTSKKEVFASSFLPPYHNWLAVSKFSFFKMFIPASTEMHSWLSLSLLHAWLTCQYTHATAGWDSWALKENSALTSFALGWVAFPFGQGSVFHGSGAPGGARRALRRFWIGVAALLPWRDLLQDARRSGTFMEWRPGLRRPANGTRWGWRILSGSLQLPGSGKSFLEQRRV